MTQRGEHAELLALALEAVKRASKVILDVYREDFAVRQKLDASPVTLADEHAEAVILETLRAGAPEIVAIAEEQAEKFGLPESVPSRFWIIDPLDGTKEFVSRNGEFTVNIGLVENHGVALGVVHAPALDLTYAASGPGTAVRQQNDGEFHPIAARPVPQHGAIVLHSRSHADENRLGAFIAEIPGATRAIAGSSIKFCRVAEGEADLYPRFGTTMEWDTAAGQAVLEAAGGSVMTFDGTPLRYGKVNFRNPDFIARGRG
jgi:3'(2'), 5'-bisphosphate nucleotidase